MRSQSRLESTQKLIAYAVQPGASPSGERSSPAIATSKSFAPREIHPAANRRLSRSRTLVRWDLMIRAPRCRGCKLHFCLQMRACSPGGYVIGALAGLASSSNCKGSPRSLSCETTWSATAYRSASVRPCRNPRTILDARLRAKAMRYRRTSPRVHFGDVTLGGPNG